MSDYAIEISGLWRGYPGVEAVKDLNLQVARGSICGLLGRNGAGKSTVMRVLAGLMKPHRGSALVNGRPPMNGSAEERKALGYLSERQAWPTFLSAKKLFNFCQRLQPDWDRPLAERVLGRLGVEVRRKIWKLSPGQQKIVAFALAVAQRPAVLLLDEPSASLDAVARREMLDAVLELARDNGTTVLLSTHILSDVERVANQIAIMAGGTLKIVDSLDRLKETVRRVRFFGPEENLARLALPRVFSLRRDRGEVVAVLRAEDENFLARTSLAAGCEYETAALSLEDIFVEITGPDIAQVP